MFFAFLIFDPNLPFCKGYSLCMDYSLCKMAAFQNGLISRIFGVFSSGFFAKNNCYVLVEYLVFFLAAFSGEQFQCSIEWFFACFWHF